MFIRFDVIHERDRQTDGQTDTACRHIPRFCIASRGKNWRCIYSFQQNAGTWRTDRRTPHDGRLRLCIAWLGKNIVVFRFWRRACQQRPLSAAKYQSVHPEGLNISTSITQRQECLYTVRTQLSKVSVCGQRLIDLWQTVSQRRWSPTVTVELRWRLRVSHIIWDGRTALMLIIRQQRSLCSRDLSRPE